jgi:hypothetical protein
MRRALVVCLSLLTALAPTSWAAAWGWRRACRCANPCVQCPRAAVCAPFDVCETVILGYCGPVEVVDCSEAAASPAAPTENLRPTAPDEMPEPPIDPPVIEDNGEEEVAPAAVDPLEDPGPETDEPPVDETPMPESPVDETPATEPSVADPSADEPPGDVPPAEAPEGDDEPPAIDPGIFDPPTRDNEPEVVPDPTDEPPATEPETDPLEGIFGGGGGTASPFDLAEPGAGAAEPAASDETAPSNATPQDDAAAGGEAGDEEAGSALDDDLFGTSSPSESTEPDQVQDDDSTRVWTDASGRFSCEAQFVQATADGVVLQRVSDGVEILIRYRRLSDADLRYLRDQIDAADRPDDEGTGDLVALRG